MHRVRYFLVVADTLNFTRAAELCNVSQPALTRAIQQLEEELGGLLLRRERKLTHLTDFGRLIQPHLRQLLADAEAAKTTAKRFLSLHGGADPSRDHVQRRAGALHELYGELPRRQPGLRDHSRRGCPGAALGDAAAGRARPRGDGPARAVQRTARSSPSINERFCIAFPTGHRLDQQNRVEISDVAGETYLRRINCEYRDYLADQLRSLGLAVRVGFQSEREDWIQMMVAAGFGVYFLPEFSPTIPGAPTQPVTDPEVVREVSLVSRSGRRLSPAVMSFIRAIRSHDWAPGGIAETA